MTYDPTETLRRNLLAAGRPQRDLAVAGERWGPQELARDFVVHAFLTPFIHVTRKSDGAVGSMEFTHSPRWYFNFVKDEEASR